MSAQKIICMAGLAQSHAGVLETLLDVVGITWTRLITDGAGQLLDRGQVLPLPCSQIVVQTAALSIMRLVASVDRHTSIRASAATNPQRSSSFILTASLKPSKRAM